MLDQLRRFEFWPVPRCQFMPVDVVSLGTIRARGRAFGSHNRDTVNQEPVLPDLLTAVEAGANMKLRCAQFLTRELRSNTPCFGARGHERVQFVVVDVFSQRAYQGETLSLSSNTSFRGILLFRTTPGRLVVRHSESARGWNA